MLVLTLIGCMFEVVDWLGNAASRGYESLEFVALDMDCAADVYTLDAYLQGETPSTVTAEIYTDETGSTVDRKVALSADYENGGAGIHRFYAEDIELPCTSSRLVVISATNMCEELSEQVTWEAAEIGDIVPDVGPSDGGQQVLVGLREGSYDWSSVELYFGQGSSTWAAASDVQIGTDCSDLETDACITATSPDYGSAETVSLRLVDANGNETLSQDAYTFHSPNRDMPTGLGRAMMIAFDPTWFYLGSPYGSIGESYEYLQVDLLMHEPIDGPYHMWDAAPAVGECSWGESMWTTLDVGTYVELHGDVADATLPNVGGGVYYYLDSNSGHELYAGEAVDLEIPDGVESYPAQTIPDAFVFPELLRSTSFGDPSEDEFGVQIVPRGDDIVLSWTPGEDMDGLTYTLSAVQDYTTLSTTTCTVDPDAGVLVVPWTDLVESGDTGSVDGILVDMEFWKDNLAVVPHDGSTFWARSTIWLESYVAVVEP
ncbi:MAG TPA: hypothetical protein QGF58_11435 [Myxococcota bacterium]|nr:hypothetical protein [Myxococcota bacterium]